MFKKILSWLLILQHVNVYVLQAHRGDIRIEFKDESTAARPSFKLTLSRKNRENQFEEFYNNNYWGCRRLGDNLRWQYGNKTL